MQQSALAQGVQLPNPPGSAQGVLSRSVRVSDKNIRGPFEVVGSSPSSFFKGPQIFSYLPACEC